VRQAVAAPSGTGATTRWYCETVGAAAFHHRKMGRIAAPRGQMGLTERVS
jgi:phosphoglucomutase